MSLRIRNRQHALYGGIVCAVAAWWLLDEAYEKRGINRPKWTKWLPGL